MHRFYLPPDQAHGGELRLTGREAHHAQHVLRLRPGDPLTVLDGAGRQWNCTVTGHGRDWVALSVLESRRQPEPACRITLVQALPKGRMFEDIVQHATELGVYRIVPLLAERVVTHLDSHDAARKVEKWRQTAIEAIKQCGLSWLPEIASPVTPAQFLGQPPTFELPLLASLQNVRKPLRDYVTAFEKLHGHKPRSACVWVGPEGDFTPEETDRITAAGCQPLSLGANVLRVETAAICALSLLNYELQP